MIVVSINNELSSNVDFEIAYKFCMESRTYVLSATAARQSMVNWVIGLFGIKLGGRVFPLTCLAAS